MSSVSNSRWWFLKNTIYGDIGAVVLCFLTDLFVRHNSLVEAVCWIPISFLVVVLFCGGWSRYWTGRWFWKWDEV